MNLKMTRMEFLQFLGVAVLTVFGIGNLMAFIARVSSQHEMKPLRKSTGSGFGTRAFGE